MTISKASILLLLVASGALAQETAPQTVIAYRPADGKVQAWNPYDSKTASPLFINAVIERRSVKAMVDTGVTFSTLDSTWARRAGLHVDTSFDITLSASGGAARAFKGPVVDLQIPPYSVGKLQTLAIDLNGAANAAEHPIDIMVGMDVISAGSLELDLANQGWRLGPTGLTWPRASRVPLRYTPDRYHSYVEINVEGHPLKLGVDTGYTGGLMLTAKAAALTGLFRRGRATTKAAQGSGGIAITQMTIPDRLRFGDLMLQGVPVDIEEANGLPTQWRLDGLVGVDLLRHLHAAFDFPAGTLFYVRSETFVVPEVRSTMGIQALRQDDSLVIVHVMANSPAGESVRSTAFGLRTCRSSPDQASGVPRYREPA